jgi:glycosyltransferase involved in cell wall biosynthesis
MTGKILIIIPAFNEENNIKNVLESIKSMDIESDILVINDGSNDNTSLIAKSVSDTIVIDLPVNLGIGGAVQTGFIYASTNMYNIAIQFDGDGQHNANEINKLIQPFLDKKADVVIGSRFLKKTGWKPTLYRRTGIRIFQIVNSILIKQKITDNTSGFRAYNKRSIDFLAKNYPQDYPEPEAVVLLGKNKFKIMEIPVEMNPRTLGKSSISSLKSIYYMIKVLFSIFLAFIRPKV